MGHLLLGPRKDPEGRAYPEWWNGSGFPLLSAGLKAPRGLHLGTGVPPRPASSARPHQQLVPSLWAVLPAVSSVSFPQTAESEASKWLSYRWRLCTHIAEEHLLPLEHWGQDENGQANRVPLRDSPAPGAGHGLAQWPRPSLGFLSAQGESLAGKRPRGGCHRPSPAVCLEHQLPGPAALSPQEPCRAEA